MLCPPRLPSSTHDRNHSSESLARSSASRASQSPRAPVLWGAGEERPSGPQGAVGSSTCAPGASHLPFPIPHGVIYSVPFTFLAQCLALRSLSHHVSCFCSHRVVVHTPQPRRHPFGFLEVPGPYLCGSHSAWFGPPHRHGASPDSQTGSGPPEHPPRMATCSSVAPIPVSGLHFFGWPVTSVIRTWAPWCCQVPGPIAAVLECLSEKSLGSRAGPATYWLSDLRSLSSPS